MSLPSKRAQKENPSTTYASLLLRHLVHGHSFGFTDVSLPQLPTLIGIHNELHEKERGKLATHEHPWVILEISSFSTASEPFPTRRKVEEAAVARFGPEVGKEYIVVRWI